MWLRWGQGWALMLQIRGILLQQGLEAGSVVSAWQESVNPPSDDVLHVIPSR